MARITEMLYGLDLFKNSPQKIRRELDMFEPRSYDAGQAIFLVGEEVKKVFILVNETYSFLNNSSGLISHAFCFRILD